MLNLIPREVKMSLCELNLFKENIVFILGDIRWLAIKGLGIYVSLVQEEEIHPIFYFKSTIAIYVSRLSSQRNINILMVW